MAFTTRTAQLGFLLALTAITAAPPAAEAALGAGNPIEARLRRIAAAARERQVLPPAVAAAEGQRLAYGFANRIGPGGWVNGGYRGGFANAHPYYGGGRFVNGGGGFVNAPYYGGGSFVNRPIRGGVFRNW